MKISNFYRSLNCDNIDVKDSNFANSREGKLYDAISIMCDLLKETESQEVIIKNIQSVLNYDSSWFEFSWQTDEIRNRDIFAFKRFLFWLSSKKYKILESNIRVEIDGLSTNVALFCSREDGRYEAMSLSFEKSDISFEGRSIHTNCSSRLEFILPKLYFEEKYPFCIVSFVTMMNGEDTNNDMTAEFLELSTKKSNYFSTWFGEYYSGNKFNVDSMRGLIKTIKSAPGKKDCYGCSKRFVCSQKPIKQSIIEADNPHDYKVPNYSEEQLKVVHYVKGNAVVIAGPGRGKTACFTGRAKYLVEQGVPIGDIVIFSFTNKAVDELKERLGENYRVYTLHAYAFELLRQFEHLLPHGVKLLSEYDEKEIIDRFIHNYPKMNGINNRQKNGKNGYISQLKELLNDFFNNNETFFETHPDIDNSFLSFAYSIKAYFELNGYIFIDDVIKQAVSLLSNEDLKNLVKIPFIMVDEYQDVDEYQARLVDILSSGNLVVVGDDDQAIYSFRNGSNKWMLNFEERWPDAKRFVLETNYRSDAEIVAYADKFISKNQFRFSKESVAFKSSKGNAVHYSNNTLEDTIEMILSKGYSYGDIAILTRGNSLIDKICAAERYPYYSTHQKLIYTPIFGVLYSALAVSFGTGDKSPLLQGLNDNYCEELIEIIRCMPYENFLDSFFQCLKDNEKVNGMFVGEKEIISIATEVSSTYELYQLMYNMRQLEDDTEVDEPVGNRISLLTAHSSKGKEFPVVIVHSLSDFDPPKDAPQEDIEECRRLLYVAMTRAECELILLDNGKKTSELL